MKPSPLPVVLTRPQADAQAWVKALNAQHCEVWHLPLIEVQPAPLTAELQTKLASALQHTALMFVSANAVRYFFDWANAAGVSWPAGDSAAPLGPRCWAPGPATAQALLRCGVPPSAIDQPPANAQQFDSESLWSVVAAQVNGASRVLVLRGATKSTQDAPVSESDGQGRQWLADQCVARGASVSFAAVYQRAAPSYTARIAQVLRACEQEAHSVWLASSSEGLLNLQALLQMWPGNAQAFYGQRLVATHPRIAQQAALLGWQRVYASKPALPDVLAALKSLPV